MKHTAAEIIREYGPFPGVEQRARRHLRRRARLVRLRRQAERARSGRAARRCARSTSPPTPARPSTASTCSRSPRIASRRSIPRPAACSPPFPRPAEAAIPGSPGPRASLWVGQYRGRKIHQIDPETGAILRTIESQSLRHRRHLGRRRTLARHLGRRRKRAAAHRSANRRGAGARSTCRPGRASPGSNPTAATASSAAAATTARCGPCAGRRGARASAFGRGPWRSTRAPCGSGPRGEWRSS